MLKLPKINGQYKFNYNLAHLTWFKVGGPAELFYKPYNREDLIFFMQQNSGNIPVTTIGAGSNILIRDGGIEGVVIKLGKNFTDIKLIGNQLEVGAGCLNFNLAKFCQINSIVGLEFLIGIPGTIGGGIAMNAGAYGVEFKDRIISVEAISSSGELLTLSLDEIGFKYRGNNLPKDLIIISAIFAITYGKQDIISDIMNNIQKERAKTQPINEKTGGSTFANIYEIIDNEKKVHNAWKLIDQAGFRGFKIGDAAISDKHTNFMINQGRASAQDLENLGELVKNKIFENTGLKLEWEIKRMGKHA